MEPRQCLRRSMANRLETRNWQHDFGYDKAPAREELVKVDRDYSLSEADVLAVQLYADPLPMHTN